MATYDRLKAAAAEVQAAVAEVVNQAPPSDPPPSDPPPTGDTGFINAANPTAGWTGESDHGGGAWSADQGVLSAANNRLVVTSAPDHKLASAVKNIFDLPAGQTKTLRVSYEAGADTPVGISVLSFAGGLTRLVDEKALTGNQTFTKTFTVPADGAVALYLMAYSTRAGAVRFSAASIS
jgi:hypothetical protein